MQKLTYKLIYVRGAKKGINSSYDYADWCQNDFIVNQEEIKREFPNMKLYTEFKPDGFIIAYSNMKPEGDFNPEWIAAYIQGMTSEASISRLPFAVIDETSSPSELRNFIDDCKDLKFNFDKCWEILEKNKVERDQLNALAGYNPNEHTVKEPDKVSEPIIVNNSNISDKGLGIENENSEPTFKASEVLEMMKKIMDAYGNIQSDLSEIKLTMKDLLNKENKVIPENNQDANPSINNLDNKETSSDNTEVNIDDKKNEESIPVVDMEKIDKNKNGENIGTYQNTVFYPENPNKTNNGTPNGDKPNISSTETDIIEVPSKDEIIKKMSENENKTPETVIYHREVAGPESDNSSLWDKILTTASNESVLNEEIISNFNNLPDEIKNDFLKFNMWDKYKNNKISIISKTESVRRKVKVKLI